MFEFLKKYAWLAIFVIISGIISVFIFREKEKKPMVSLVEAKSEKIGWITDLHANNKKMDGGESGIIYAEKFEEYFSDFLGKMEKEKTEIVIITGDNVHEGKIKYAQKLKEIEKGHRVKILWVRGNHDKEVTGVMETLGVADPYYYVYDTKNTRIIVLNLTENEKVINEKQFNWFRERLIETNLPVIVAAHAPIINYEKQIIFPRFEDLEAVMRESGKVKFVISGSLHQEKEFNLNGIFYKTAFPLALKNNLGSYYIIDVKNNTIQGLNLENNSQ